MMEYTASYKNIARIEMFSSPAGLAAAFLHFLALQIMEAAGKGDDFNIALSGGSTPRQIFRNTPEGWGSPYLLRRMKLFWGDERCVPPDSDQSNYGNARKDWFSRISVPETNINRIRGEEDPEEEAIRYGSLLKGIPQKNDLPHFNLVLLGIGEYGHTASIFPADMDLLNSDKLVTTTRHPDTGQQRITMTGPVINNAAQVLFLVTGSGKAELVSEVFNDSEKAKSFPAYHIRPKGSLTWFMDEAAGSLYKLE